LLLFVSRDLVFDRPSSRDANALDGTWRSKSCAAEDGILTVVQSTERDETSFSGL